MVEAVYHNQEGAPGMCGKLPQPHHVCRACTPPLSRPLSAEPHTMSLSLDCSRVCY